jgi:hypothetical protein
MVRGEIVKRSWSKKSQISEHTELLDIWDTGSHIFERWPNGDEVYWKVISREEFNTGIIEILEKMPIWQVPGEVLYRQQIPLLRQTDSHFQLGAWNVEQVVEKHCNTDVMIDINRKNKERNCAYNKGKRHSPHQGQFNIKEKIKR